MATSKDNLQVREKLVELIHDFAEYLDRRGAEYLADHLLANGVTVQEWIPVSERLPEKNEDVLAYSNKNGGYMFFGYRGYISGAWMEGGGLHIGDVTHWMPMPTPPKGE